MTENNNTHATAPEEIGNHKRRINQLSPECCEIRETKVFKIREEMDKIGNKTMRDLVTAVTQAVKEQMSGLAKKADIDNLLEEIRSLKQENAELKDIIDNLKQREIEILNRIENLEGKLRMKNLIFRGVKLNSEEKPVNVVRQMCTDILKLERPAAIINAYQIGASSSKEAPILVEFDSSTTARSVIAKGKQLKGTGITIHKDYSRQMRVKRRVLFKLKNELNNLNENVNIVIRDDRLVIENQVFKFVNNKIMFGNKAGLEMACNLFSNKEKAKDILLEVENLKFINGSEYSINAGSI